MRIGKIFGKIKDNRNLALFGVLLGIPAFILTSYALFEVIFPQFPQIVNEEIKISKETKSHCMSPMMLYSFAKSAKSNSFSFPPECYYTIHRLSCILINPSDYYAVLQKIWVEIVDYKNNEFYRLPEPGKPGMFLRYYGAISGPVERYEEKICLKSDTKKIVLFEQNKKVFPKGETEEFIIRVIAAPGKYRYRVFHEWQIPQKDRVYLTSTKDYSIEEFLLHDPQDTYNLFKNTEKELIILSSSISDIKNFVSLIALEDIPKGVDIRVLIPKKTIMRTEHKNYLLFDRKKILIEVMNENSEDRIGELIEDKEKIQEIIKNLEPNSFESHRWQTVYPFLGIRGRVIDKEFQKNIGLPSSYGVLITPEEEPKHSAVIPGSPADKAGIVENDIILEIDGKEINTENSWYKALQNKMPGDKLSLKIYHKGNEMEINVVLGEWPT